SDTRARPLRLMRRAYRGLRPVWSLRAGERVTKAARQPPASGRRRANHSRGSPVGGGGVVSGPAPREREDPVKRLRLLVTAGTVGVTLVIAGGAGARSQSTGVTIDAAMTAANETPAPKGDVSNARGTFTATLTKTDSGASMAWRLEFSNLTGPATAAHVHVA